jgi:hypothetical protein
MSTPDVQPVHHIEQKHAPNEPQYGSRSWQDEVIQQTWNDPNALAKKLEECAVKYNSPQGASELLEVANERHHKSAAWVDQIQHAADKVDPHLWEDLAIAHVEKTKFFQNEQHSSLLSRDALLSSQLDTIGRDATMPDYRFNNSNLWGKIVNGRDDQQNTISQNDIDARYNDMRNANQTARANSEDHEYSQHLNRILDQQVVVGATHKSVRQLISDQSMSGYGGVGDTFSCKVQSLIGAGYLTPGQKAALEPLANDPEKAARFLAST